MQAGRAPACPTGQVKGGSTAGLAPSLGLQVQGEVRNPNASSLPSFSRSEHLSPSRSSRRTRASLPVPYWCALGGARGGAGGEGGVLRPPPAARGRYNGGAAAARSAPIGRARRVPADVMVVRRRGRSARAALPGCLSGRLMAAAR